MLGRNQPCPLNGPACSKGARSTCNASVAVSITVWSTMKKSNKVSWKSWGWIPLMLLMLAASVIGGLVLGIEPTVVYGYLLDFISGIIK